jgi:hypothetical protein
MYKHSTQRRVQDFFLSRADSILRGEGKKKFITVEKLSAPLPLLKKFFPGGITYKKGSEYQKRE